MKHRKKIYRKNLRKIKIHTYSVVGGILFTFGAILLMIWGTHRIISYQSLYLTSALLSTFTPVAVYQTHITNIRVGTTIDLPVIESGYVNGTWIISPNNANHVSQSASPGNPGNTIIYAHNTPHMFGPLRATTKGDTVILTLNNGAEFIYRVSQTAEVNPADVSLLRPTLTEVVTLYTCSGFLDSKRFVIRAIPEIPKKM